MDTLTVRVTKAQKLEAIKAFIPEDVRHVFPGDDKRAAFVFDHAAIMKFIDDEIALLAKKNSGDKKMTKNQENNEVLKEKILEYLSGLPSDSHGVQCTTMFKEIPEFAEFSSNKVSALCRQLKLSGKIIASEEKGKTLFSLA